MTRFKKIIYAHPAYLFWIIFLSVLIFISLLAPLLPLHPDNSDVSNLSQGPSLTHIFGTDDLGRDYFSRVIYGGRISIFVGFVAMAVSIFFGVLIGTLSAYFGGIADTILMRILDIFSSVPWLVLVVVLSSFLKPGLATIIIIIGAFSWMPIARLVRAEVASAKEREFVVYGQFLGESALRVINHHILPIILPTIVTAAGAQVANAIMTESALSFLGMGVQDPLASWGSLLQSAQSRLQDAPYMAIIPGIFIILTVLAFNKIGNLLSLITSPETEL